MAVICFLSDKTRLETLRVESRPINRRKRVTHAVVRPENIRWAAPPIMATAPGANEIQRGSQSIQIEHAYVTDMVGAPDPSMQYTRSLGNLRAFRAIDPPLTKGDRRFCTRLNTSSLGCRNPTGTPSPRAMKR